MVSIIRNITHRVGRTNFIRVILAISLACLSFRVFTHENNDFDLYISPRFKKNKHSLSRISAYEDTGHAGHDSVNGEKSFNQYRKIEKFGVIEENEDTDQSKENGYPRIVILWTTWRSGSTFLGDLLVSAVPDTFYSYEPLIPYGTNIIRTEEDSLGPLTYISDLFKCNLTDHRWQLRRLVQTSCYRRRNTYLMDRCKSAKVDCGSPVVVSEACKSAKFHFVKMLRLGLVWARKLLEDPTLNIQIIYLVRDPRPVMRSRQPYAWCRSDCRNITNVCRHLRHDMEDSSLLQKDYPDRFKFVQYEHLSLKTEEKIREIWKFLGLTLSKEALDKVHNLTSGDGPSGRFDTNRDTEKHTFNWRQEMSFHMISMVQKECGDILRKLGLRSFASSADLRNMAIPSFLSQEELQK